jgi:hypothetical protein
LVNRRREDLENRTGGRETGVAASALGSDERARRSRGQICDRNRPDVEQMHAAYGAHTEALQKAGVIVGGERLRPSTAASTVRIANGKTRVLDGPCAETKKQLGGCYMIDVPDLDGALSWVARCPTPSRRPSSTGARAAFRGAPRRS